MNIVRFVILLSCSHVSVEMERSPTPKVTFTGHVVSVMKKPGINRYLDGKAALRPSGPPQYATLKAGESNDRAS